VVVVDDLVIVADGAAQKLMKHSWRLCMLQEATGHEATIPEVEAELQLRGGFFPLMHLFPREEDTPGLSIPWTPADARLREWMASSSTYQTAIAGG
jgi:hypothetical protein